MADAVLGVTLQMTEWQGGDNPLIMLQAVGTAVQLETIP
jgi:uncharacterized protein YbjQ (UPF0145 family)